jgi:hypothetical protein
MNFIKVLRGCGASGKSLVAGTVYAVPREVSESDARLLVQIGKAIVTDVTVAESTVPKARKRSKAE